MVLQYCTLPSIHTVPSTGVFERFRARACNLVTTSPDTRAPRHRNPRPATTVLPKSRPAPSELPRLVPSSTLSYVRCAILESYQYPVPTHTCNGIALNGGKEADCRKLLSSLNNSEHLKRDVLFFRKFAQTYL
jgi:hypothetical protein